MPIGLMLGARKPAACLISGGYAAISIVLWDTCGTKVWDDDIDPDDDVIADSPKASPVTGVWDIPGKKFFCDKTFTKWWYYQALITGSCHVLIILNAKRFLLAP